MATMVSPKVVQPRLMTTTPRRTKITSPTSSEIMIFLDLSSLATWQPYRPLRGTSAGERCAPSDTSVRR